MKQEIIHGDFRNHRFPDDCFVISDPPYNQDYHYNEYKDGLGEEDYSKLLMDAFRDYRSVIILYPEQTINILGGGEMGRCEECVSWVYPSNTAKQSRLISWWNCKPDFRAVGQPYKNPTDKRIAKRIADGKTARSYDWWEINQVKNVSKSDNAHPCPIPYELALKIILTTTKEGDTIVDPFAGSGTIGLAARDSNRNFIGFEINEEYCEIARNRLNK